MRVFRRSILSAASLVTLLASASLLAPAASAAPTPISETPSSPPPAFIGAPAQAQPIFTPDPPRHPFMAQNPWSNLHDDAYMTDTYQGPGPLGRSPGRLSSLLEGVCASITFDSRGRIVTACVGLEGPKLVMADARTLDTLATMALPPRQPSVGGSIFNDFAGGGYFYLDNADRAVIPTTSRHVFIVAEGPGGNGFERVRDYDVTSAVPAGDKIISALPDWSGRIWFASTRGTMGTIDPATGAVRAYRTGEGISNSFSVDETGGVYAVTRKALYRFDAASSGAPEVTWREVYDNSGISKPGQSDAGSGTTPTLMGDEWISIADNADPMQVVVYKRAKRVRGSRKVCEQPVFAKGKSSTDQSLIGTYRSMVVENNYGYTGPSSTLRGARTTAGLERVDIDRDGRGCHTVWKSTETSPSAVPKLSAATGLVYTYTEGAGSDDPWYLTALDFRTGRTVYKALAGSGFGFNNNYAAVTFGPDATMYIGVFGGIAAVRDSSPPPRSVAPRPRVALRFLRLRSGRIRVRLSGSDTGAVGSVVYTVRRRTAAARRPPFSRLLGLRALGRGRSVVVSARVRMLDGRRVALRRVVRLRRR